MSRLKPLLLATAGAMAIAGCAADAPPRKPEANAEDISFAERGLRLASREAERKAAMSARRTDHQALKDYIRPVNCRVTGDHYSAIRAYAMHMPDFNASMAPNGFEQIWTGLVLRVENEAQLAAILKPRGGALYPTPLAGTLSDHQTHLPTPPGGPVRDRHRRRRIGVGGAARRQYR